MTDVCVFLEELTLKEALSKVNKLKLKKHAKLGFYYRLVELSNGKMAMSIFRPVQVRNVVKENCSENC